MKKELIPPERFVEAYMESYLNKRTVQELSVDLNISVQSCTSRISRMRRHGVKLPKLRALRDFDAEKLNKIIEARMHMPRHENVTPPKKQNKVKYINKFEDKWNCDRCRAFGTLCALHIKMEASGSKPPEF